MGQWIIILAVALIGQFVSDLISFFEIADVGIVGNVMDIIPLMIEEIKKIKS